MENYKEYTDEEWKEVKKRLKELRESNGLTQSQLAEKLHYDLKTVQRAENKNEKVSFAYLEKVAEYFDKCFDYFFGRINESDYNLKYICEYTGLSEEAVSVLHNAMEKRKLWIENFTDDEKKQIAEAASNPNYYIDAIINNAELRYHLMEYILFSDPYAIEIRDNNNVMPDYHRIIAASDDICINTNYFIDGNVMREAILRRIQDGLNEIAFPPMITRIKD